MSLTTQFYTMIAMIAVGSYFGAALDTYSRLFNRSRRKLWFIFINDILFWILQALFIFYCLYSINYGEVRFYIFVALVCGFAFYQSLLKQVYIHFLELVIRFVIRTYKVGTKFTNLLLVRPIIVSFTFILSVMLAIGKFLLKIFTILGQALLYILRIISKPMAYFIKMVWKVVPNSIKIKVNNYFRNIINFIQRVIRFFTKNRKK